MLGVTKKFAFLDRMLFRRAFFRERREFFLAGFFRIFTLIIYVGVDGETPRLSHIG